VGELVCAGLADLAEHMHRLGAVLLDRDHHVRIFEHGISQQRLQLHLELRRVQPLHPDQGEKRQHDRAVLGHLHFGFQLRHAENVDGDDVTGTQYVVGRRVGADADELEQGILLDGLVDGAGCRLDILAGQRGE